MPYTPRPDSREAIILAAERLFAERGINGVSLREVAAEAGQRNNSAVAYHFTSREGLVEAVFRYRMARIDERRRALLVALDASGRGDDLDALVEAVVLPLAESLGHDDGVSWYARFLRQVLADPDFDAVAPPLDDVTHGLRAVIDRLHRQLRRLPDDLRGHRVALAVQLVVAALADYEATLASLRPADYEATLASSRPALPAPLVAADIVDAATAVLRAPVSAATALQLRHTTRKGA